MVPREKTSDGTIYVNHLPNISINHSFLTGSTISCDDFFYPNVITQYFYVSYQWILSEKKSDLLPF